MFKRTSFPYYNDLAIIVGNDIADGTGTTTAGETEEGHYNRPAQLDDDDDDATVDVDGPDCGTSFETQPDLDDETATPRSCPSTGSSQRRVRKRKASLASSLDMICETMQTLTEGLKVPQVVTVDHSQEQAVLGRAWKTLKAMPQVSSSDAITVYETLMNKPAILNGFVSMETDEDRLMLIDRICRSADA